jgi:hypothetical protein
MDDAPSVIELVPLIITGGACLLGLGQVGPDKGHPHPVRWPTIGLLFTASMAHVPVIAPHLKEAPYMGVLFIAFAVSAFVIAALLAASPSPVLYATAAVLCGAGLVAYAATRLVPFPMLADDVGNWAEPLGLVSIAAEVGVVMLFVAARKHLYDR